MTNHWQVIRLSNSLGDHAAAWDALNQHLYQNHPLLDSRFVNGLLKYFGNGTEHLCVLTSNGAPEAMCLLRPQGLGTWASFLPSQAQIGPTLIQAPDMLARLMRSLPGIVVKLDFLCNDPNFGDMSAGDASASHSLDHALTMSIRLDGTFEAYWAARSNKLIQNVGRYERRLVTDKVARKLVCITNPQAMSDAVARYATLESKGWKGLKGTAVGNNNVQGRFYIDLMERYAGAGCAMVFELWFDDRLAASRLIIASKNMLIMVKTTYDEALDKYSPGRLLLHDAIECLFTKYPDKIIEFYTDANDDQLAWATGQRWISHCSFYRNGFTHTIFDSIKAVKLSLLASSRTAAHEEVGYTVDLIKNPDTLPLDVKQLFDKVEQENFQLGTPWLQTLVSTVFPKHPGVGIYVLRRSGKAIAALPILGMKKTSGSKIESLSNFYTSLYSPAISQETKDFEIAELVGAVLTVNRSVGSLRFSPMDPDSIAYRRLIHALRRQGLFVLTFFCFGNWYLQNAGAWSNYLVSRSGTLRSTIKRMTKKLTGDGGSLEIIVGGAEVERGIQVFQQVYASSWKVMEPFSEFIPSIIKTYAGKGMLRMGIASLRGQPIAAQLWFVSHGKAYIFKVSYDEKFKAYAPGTLVTAILMEYVLDKDRVEEVDFLTGDDLYKKSWMSHRRERWGIIAFNPKTVNGLLGLTKEVLGRTLMHMIRNIKSRISEIKNA